jgi:hypothetical protein
LLKRFNPPLVAAATYGGRRLNVASILLSANGAYSNESLGATPQYFGEPKPPALKARFVRRLQSPDNESHFQRLFTFVSISWGDPPRLK